MITSGGATSSYTYGFDIPVRYVSRSSTVEIVFTSDYSVSAQGFNLTYKSKIIAYLLH